MKRFFIVTLMSLGILIFFHVKTTLAIPTSGADDCTKNYPQTGQCIPQPECTAKTGFSPLPSLCTDVNLICCVSTDEQTQKSPQAPAGVNPSGRTAANLLSDASNQLNPTKLAGPTDLIKRAINLLLAFIGSISLALYMWAGVLWMTAAGEEKRIGTAKSIVVWTSLGVLVMLLSYTIVNFVLTAIK